jgi:hypothetical protein
MLSSFSFVSGLVIRGFNRRLTANSNAMIFDKTLERRLKNETENLFGDHLPDVFADFSDVRLRRLQNQTAHDNERTENRVDRFGKRLPPAHRNERHNGHGRGCGDNRAM